MAYGFMLRYVCNGDIQNTLFSTKEEAKLLGEKLIQEGICKAYHVATYANGIYRKVVLSKCTYGGK